MYSNTLPCSHGGRCRTRFTASERPKSNLRPSRRVRTVHVRRGHHDCICKYRESPSRATPHQCAPFWPPNTHTPPLTLPSAEESACNISAEASRQSFLYSKCNEEVLAFHQDPERPFLHASNRTSPRRKSGTTNHRHVCQCSIPRQRRPVPLVECRSSCGPVVERMCLALE